MAFATAFSLFAFCHRQARRSLSLVLIERIAHVRGGCTPGNSRLGAVSCAHACTNRWRTCAAQCLGSQFAPWGGKLRLRLCEPPAHVRGGLHPGQFAARGRAGQIAPLGPGPQWGPSRTDRAGRRDARFARAHRAVSARPRPSAWALNSRPWQLASLVLINRLAHVRGPVPGLSIRAHGSSLPLVLIKRIAHVRGPVPGAFSAF